MNWYSTTARLVDPDGYAMLISATVQAPDEATAKQIFHDYLQAQNGIDFAIRVTQCRLFSGKFIRQ